MHVLPIVFSLKMIAEFLFHVASEAELLWISAEALDAIFDVFAEDDTNHVLHNFQMVDKMQRLLPKFLQKVGSIGLVLDMDWCDSVLFLLSMLHWTLLMIPFLYSEIN